jgi:hypothetical protein
VGLFSRAAPLPRDVREQMTLHPGERLLAWAPAGTGWVVATTQALWLPVRARLERVGWEAVDSAAWNRDETALTVVQAAPLGGRPRRWVTRMDDARDLLLVVKERVRATVVLSRRVAVQGDRAVTIVGRRPPGTDRLTWTVSVDGGVDVDDPAVRAAVEEALREARASVGA